MALKKSKKPATKTEIFRSNLQKVKEKFEQDGGGDKWLKLRDGKNAIRILPPWGKQADGLFYLKGGLHYGFSIGGRDRAIACPDVGGRGKCPVCLVVGIAKNKGDDYKDLVNRIRVKIKYWVNVIDRRRPEKVLMYGMSKKAWKLISEPMGDDEDPIDATDPEEGYDMIINKEGSGMMTRYSERMRPKPSPIGTDDWMDHLHQLDTEVLEWMSEEEMKKHLKSNFGDVLSELGIKFGKPTKGKPTDEDDDDEEEDDDELPRKSKKKVKTKPKRSKADDDDEDDEEVDEDEDEDEDDD